MIASRHIEVFVMIFASIAAIYVGSQIVALPLPLLAITTSLVLLALWAFLAGNAWWVPILAAAMTSGVFRVGVKVTPIMAGLAIALIGLAPLIFVRGEKVLQHQRRRLPFIFYATGIFVILRLSLDIIHASGERSNLIRVLIQASWPFVFCFFFHHFGSLSVARTATWLAFFFLIFRCLMALLGDFTGVPIYVPGIDFVFSLNSHDSLISMRTVAFSLLLVTLVLFHSVRGLIPKILLGLLVPASAVMVVMGQSRFNTAMMMTLPIVFFAWTRRFFLLFLSFSVCLGIFSFVNVFPQSIEKLPPEAERALSGLIVKKKVMVQDTAGSNWWHNSMHQEGFDRWTESAKTVLFGYGIRSTPDLYQQVSFNMYPQLYVYQAANLGAYETSLWTMLGLFGVVGCGLYTCLFIYFWRQTLPYLIRRPQGTFWEALLFWGCYISLNFYLVSYFTGDFPSFELVMIIIAADAIQDGKFNTSPQLNRIPSETKKPRFGPVHAYPTA
jgi:hypothetical protein